jgi:hypothetical protein
LERIEDSFSFYKNVDDLLCDLLHTIAEQCFARVASNMKMPC